MLVLFDVTEKKGIKLESKRPRLDFDDGGEGEGLRQEQVEVDPDVDDDLELAEGIVPAIVPHPDDPLHGH